MKHTRTHTRLLSSGGEVHLVSKKGVGREGGVIGAVVECKNGSATRVDLFKDWNSLLFDLLVRNE